MKHHTLLKHHHLKATPQRIAIIDLMERRGHISIDDLYQAVREKFASISLATLYKNIHSMMEASLIREVKVPGYKTRYEIEKAAHAHVLCRECGELKDIALNPLALIEAQRVDIGGYRADDAALLISGICPNCREK